MIKKMYTQACEFYESQKYEESYKIFLELAVSGNALSQAMIANMLINGLGTSKNFVLGYKWYEKAAKQNNPKSLYYYGWHCIEEQREEEGLSYIKRASNLNYVNAVYDLAGMYFHGIYTCKYNINRAICLYDKAFMLGKVDSMNNLLHVKRKKIGYLKTNFFFLKNIFRFTKVLLKNDLE